MLFTYRKKLLIFLNILFISVSFTFNSNSQDLKNVKVDQLSDKQVMEIIKRAEASGMSQEDLETAAVAKGMSQTELMKLKIRIQKLSTNNNQINSSNLKIDTSRTRKNIKLEDIKQNREYQDPFAQTGESQIKEEEYLKKLYGFDLFTSQNLTFEPSVNIATPVNYQLGPGDEILIDIWGASQQNYRLTISPEGSVFIDNVGPVNISGLTIDKAQTRIINRLSTIYSGLKGSNPNTFAQVSIGNLRSIKVNLIGEVNMPGSYTLSSLATVFNALYVSGGPAKNGSLRNIQVFRDSKLFVTLDVYDFLVNGNQKNNVRLQDQDVIKINPYQTRVELSGEFKKPMIYEALPEESLGDIIKYSGGFTDKAYSSRLRIERKNTRVRTMADVELKSFATFKLQDGDKIFADSILNKYENRVEVTGAVYRPGQYQLTDGLTIRGLLEKAEGIRGDAFLNRAIIYRLMPDFTIESIPFDLSVLMKDSTKDVLLVKEDIIKIFSIFDLQEEYNLQIDGEVLHPGKFPFIYNMSLQNLIAEAGGFKESASFSKIEISRRVKNSDLSDESAKIAEIYYFNVNKDLSISDSASKFILQPFDRVFIRRSPGYEVQATVSIAGEAIYPGSYNIMRKDERISDLVNRAGGFTKEAYQKGARLVRKLTENQKARKKILAAIEKEAESDSVKLLVNNETEQYIGIDLVRIMEKPGSKYDLILQEGDVLEIPKELQTVRLSGAVLYPITVRYDKSFNLRKYVSMAGGFSEDAMRRKTFVIYANGSADKTTSFLGIKNYPELEPGAEIIVPKKIEEKKMSPQELLGISTAMTSLALIIVTIVGKL